MYRYTGVVKGTARRAALALIAILLCGMVANAQVEIGQNVKMNLSGNLGVGYSGASGNGGVSSNNSYGITGNADLTGFYFHPNFISFEFRPYFDRNQASSDSQTVTHSTGVGGSLGLFGASRFPGSISFGKDFSGNSEFNVAGVPTVAGNTSGENIGLSWSALIPNLPTLTAACSLSSNEASLEGSARSRSSSKNLNLTSGYRLLGFDLQGNFSYNTSDFHTPSYLSGNAVSNGGSGTSYGFTTQHSLPLKGGINFGYSHNASQTNNGADWSSSSYNLGTGFSPWRKISLYQDASYTTGLIAAYAQSVLNGASPSTLKSDTNSSGFFFSAGASYQVMRGLGLNGRITHRVQWLAGQRYEDTQYGGSFNYNYQSRLFGVLYFGLGLVDTASKSGNDGAGVNANIGASRKFGRWDTSADISYSQNVQTMVSIATTSTYSYGGSVRRKINNDTHWGGSFRASHSGFVIQSGDGNSSQSVSSSLSWKRYSFSGSYSQSRGTAVLNSSGGLTSAPGGSVITDDFLLFNARSWGANASTRLFRRVTLAGGYSQFRSSTTEGSAGSSSVGDRFNVRTEYRLRKFSFVGGLNRSTQEVSTVFGGSRTVNSYYVSFSRWFNVF